MTTESGYRNDLGADVHDIDEHHIAVDYPHEVLDSYKTDWGRGCWNEGWRSAGLPVMLWNHSADQVIGRAVRAEHLGSVSRVVSRFANFERVPKAAEVHSLISDGLIPGYSFRFGQGRSIPHPTVRGARRFISAVMYETSPVTRPAIPGTRLAGIRSDDLRARMRAEPGWRRYLTPDELAMLAASPLSVSIADHVGSPLGRGWRADRIAARRSIRQEAREIAARRRPELHHFTPEELGIDAQEVLEHKIDRALERAQLARRGA